MGQPDDVALDAEVLAAALEDLRSRVSRVEAGRAVGPLTSFRIGGPASIWIEPASEDELVGAGEVIVEHGLATLVIGRGTNILLSDHGYRGVVIRLGRPFEWIEGVDTTLRAGGSAAIPQVANRAARMALIGLEFAVAIPATVGGAVRMNAGAHGGSISDVLLSVRVCRLGSGGLKDLGREALAFGYRTSALHSSDIVCAATFELTPGSEDEIRDRMAKYRQHRSDTQPVDAPNAGSMFRNPEGSAAGALIESAGLKGYTVGGAEVSRKHANFFLAHSGAKAQDVYDLMAHVQSVVETAHGVLLIPEVKLVGEFDTTSGLRHAP